MDFNDATLARLSESVVEREDNASNDTQRSKTLSGLELPSRSPDLPVSELRLIRILRLLDR
ncbi:MAG: hypothetical protein E4H20_07380 [Spirochaetales bacterium]|nr:MAG: hypothetical protein E4H20_07380 [Spirochaetales bacterium]